MFARIFIPKKHRQRFDEAVSQNVINRLCRSKSISEPQGRIRRSRSEDHSDRNRSSKRASSVPRDGEQGGRSDADRSARKSVSAISVHPPIGPHQRWAHSSQELFWVDPTPVSPLSKGTRLANRHQHAPNSSWQCLKYDLTNSIWAPLPVLVPKNSVFLLETISRRNHEDAHAVPPAPKGPIWI